MTKFIQTLMDGFAVGSLYALIALGYTMVYGILQFINFAHSDVFVLGAWLSFTVAVTAGYGLSGQPAPVADWVYVLLVGAIALAVLAVAFDRAVRPRLGDVWLRRLRHVPTGSGLLLVACWAWTSFLLVLLAGALHRSAAADWLGGLVIIVFAMATCGLVGFIIERLAYRPLRSAPRLNVLITAIGVSLLLQNTGQTNFAFGTQPQSMPALLPDRVLAEVAGVQVRLVDVIGAGTAILLMIALERLIFHTKLGRAMRAVSFNHKNAALMGINVDAVISFTFVLGAALAAAAGFLFSMKYPGLNQPAAATWVLLGLKAFVAAVIGGIGNVRGAMLGGFAIGLLELFGAAYLSPDLRDLYVFALLILVLLVRPSGILGRATIEKV